MKISHTLFLHFARQDGQDRKDRKENHAIKVNKIPETKKQKYGMNETNINYIVHMIKLSTYFLFAACIKVRDS